MRSSLAVGLLLVALLALGYLALQPGLSGVFLVDDEANLEGLADITANPTLVAARDFVLTGISSEIGRPLALATFALQHHSWPRHPGDFIYVNILLHLLNASLAFGTLLRFLRLAGAPAAAVPGMALAATGLWLFASLQLGAVLYVVQRMSVLAGTCTLLGLWLYLIGREREVAGKPMGGILLMGAGLGIGGPLGVLAKESAGLFPFLVLCMEYTLLRQLPRSVSWQRLSLVALWLPVALLLTYLAVKVPGYSPESMLRPFENTTQRLMTEARVLFVYLHKLLLPPLYGMRLYYDDYGISRSLFTPWTTATSVIGWIVLIAAALRLRTQEAAFSFAVLWYLSAHILESTVVPLEIAFDHRNYVAVLGPAVALAWYGQRLLTASITARIRPIIRSAIVAYLAFVAVACWQGAALWGKPWYLMYYWAEQHPDSKRARHGIAHTYSLLKMPDRSEEAYETALLRWPGDVSFFMGLIDLSCAYPDRPKPDLARIPGIVRNFDTTIPATMNMLDGLVARAESGECVRYSPAEMWAIVEMIFETPRLATHRPSRRLLQSRIALLAGDRTLARELLDEALGSSPLPLFASRAAALSILDGDLVCARHYLNHLASLRSKHPLRSVTHREEVARLEQALSEAAAKTPPRTPDLPSCGSTTSPPP